MINKKHFRQFLLTMKTIVVGLLLITLIAILTVAFINKYFYGCDPYLKVMESSETRKALLDLVNEKFPTQDLSYYDGRYTNGNNVVRYIYTGDYNLNFFPNQGIGVRIGFITSAPNTISAVHIGRSSRSGLVIFIDNGYEKFGLKHMIKKRIGKLAAYCPD